MRESRERVRAALASSGYEFPPGRITVNLSPADLPKASARFDLPIALGLLLALGQLALPGEHGARGARRAAGPARCWRASCRSRVRWCRRGGRAAAGPGRGARAAGRFAGAAAGQRRAGGLGAGAARACRPHAGRGGRAPVGRRAAAPGRASQGAGAAPPAPCLSDVRGQAAARRALEVCAAGGHSLLMVGPPGAGKSMLAQRLPACCRPCRPGRRWRSPPWPAWQGGAGGEGAAGIPAAPPPRAPHHTATPAALAGGGPRSPGRARSAWPHHGVLFLDELPEFRRQAAGGSCGEPLETGRVSIARAPCARWSTRRASNWWPP